LVFPVNFFASLVLGLSQLKRHRLISTKGSGAIDYHPSPNHTYANEEVIIIDEDNDFVEEQLNSATVTSVTQARTCHKSDGTTDIQAPAGSSLKLLVCKLLGSNLGGLNTMSVVLCGTTSADNAGTSADDISTAMSFNSTNSNAENIGVIILPASKYLTLVRTAINNTPTVKIDAGMIIGTETF